MTLWSLTAGQRRRYLAAMAAMGVGTVFLLTVPYVMKHTLDRLAVGEATWWGVLAPAALAIVGLNMMHGFFTYVRGRWAAMASEGIVRRLRHQLYSHLERLPCVYHDHAETGDLVQRCSSDVETLRVFLASQVVEIARVSFFLIVATPIMLWNDLRMSLISLSLTPVIVFTAAMFFRRVRSLFKEVDEAEGRLTTVLQENLSGIRVVRAFARQDFEIGKFDERNGAFRDLEFRLFIALSNFWALSDVLVFTQLGIVLIGGGWMVQQGQLSVGTWVLFFWLMRTIIWPIRHIGRVLADTGKATVAIGRLQEILDATPETDHSPVDQADSDEVEPVSGDIVIEGLSFAYPQPSATEAEGSETSHPSGAAEPLVLRNLSLTIDAGQTIAILGAPGAGKSSLVNLLVRLYDYQHGSIRIGGRELKDIPRQAVRSAFGMVLQDPFLYSKTVRDNVIVGHTSATDREVEESAQAAAIHTSIAEFQDGYHTKVGERGVTLSGGQRQRLAIARALLKDPEFLVLDDSLSAVDTKTEAHILKSLAARRGRHTTILIAHRLSSTRLADRIFVLDHGRLVQNGTHEELLASEGPYQRLWSIQGSLDDEIQRDQQSTSIATDVSGGSN